MWIVGTYFVLDRKLQCELEHRQKPSLAGSSIADDGMDKVDYGGCASSAFKSETLKSLIPCMRAKAPSETEPTDCEQKRER